LRAKLKEPRRSSVICGVPVFDYDHIEEYAAVHAGALLLDLTLQDETAAVAAETDCPTPPPFLANT
jgi:hypothetical protein